MILVVAAREGQVAAARGALRGLSLGEAELVAPAGGWRLLLSAVVDADVGPRAVLLLREKGYPAVLRPATGPQLEAWKRHTEPVMIGDRLTVTFVWSEHDRSQLPNVVEIDPAGGFGSGQHPATRLLLEAVAARITGGERVLDVGCGNGILGLSALRLGAAHLTSTDIDPRAVAATARNAALNGVADLVDHQVEGVFDVVLANVGRAALVEMGAELESRVGPGGWLAVSGFSPPQGAVVAAALRPLTVVERRVAGEWAALTLAAAPE